MKVEIFICVIVCLLIVYTYNDGKLFFLSYFGKCKKYGYIALYIVIGIGLLKMVRDKKTKWVDILIDINQYIKFAPCSKKTAHSIIDPMLHDSPPRPPIQQYLPPPPPSTCVKTTKRIVSETKKKYVASLQCWKCKQCGQMLNHTFEIDHIQSLETGGTNDVSNLAALCRNCHGVKTAHAFMY